MAGGQPVSMENMREVYGYCSALHIPVFFDATRMAENAYMIQQRDPHFQDTKIRDILREMLLYGDGCTVSGKKDFLINIGGLLAFRDNAELAEKAEAMLRVYEGNVTDGGLAASDLAAIAVGVEEMLDDRYIRARVRQTAALGQDADRGRGADRHAARQPRDLPRRDAVSAPHRPGRVPGPAAGRRDLRRDRRAGHGAGQRLQGPRPRRPARTTGRRSSSCG